MTVRIWTQGGQQHHLDRYGSPGKRRQRASSQYTKHVDDDEKVENSLLRDTNPRPRLSW